MDTSKLDVDALFKQYTIKEIQNIELQIKNEIEKKKEDLRIMVYNRYRDIIDAADGIHVMKECSGQIEKVLSDLQLITDKIFNEKDQSMFAEQDKLRTMEKNKRNNKYVSAVIIKILQNTPTKIWYHLDNNEFLKAAKQYLIAQNAHICMDIGKGLNSSHDNLVSFTQYAGELWNSIVFLSGTIVSKARETILNSKTCTSANLIDAMASVYLLENTSLKDLFTQYVSTRNQLILSSIDADRADLGASIRDRMIECLKMFVSTVVSMYDLFALDAENKVDSFETIINESSFTIETLKDDGIVVSKIPNYLKNVKFKDTVNVKRFEEEFLRNKTQEWLNDCLNEIRLKIEVLIKYAMNLKSLALIRDSVSQFEADLASNAASIMSSANSHLSWTYVCEYLFGRKVDLWSQLVAPYYLTQSKLIVESSFKSTHDNMLRNLNDYLSKSASNTGQGSPESDINSYLWSLDLFNQTNEATADNVTNGSNANNNPAATPKNQFEFFPTSRSSARLAGGAAKQLNIVLKQYSSTPSIQKLCKSLDDDLGKLLTDIEYGSFVDETNTGPDSPNEQFTNNLKDNLTSFAQAVYESLLELVNKLKQTISDDHDKHHSLSDNIGKILFICRLVHAMPHNCDNLKACFANSSRSRNQKGSDNVTLAKKTSKQSLVDSKNPGDELWTNFNDKLIQINKTGFTIWIEHLCNEISRLYFSALSENKPSTVDSFALITQELISWDEIEIEDELSADQSEETTYTDQADHQPQAKTTKNNSTFKSKLSAPLVCSASIQNVLYWLCQQLTQNLTYTMIDSHLILKELILSVLDLTLKTYQRLYERNQAMSDSTCEKLSLTQNQSLQIIFDLKYLFGLFEYKPSLLASNTSEFDEQINTKYAKLIEEYKKVSALYESLIDPFDYDICLPFMQSNVAKALARSSTLFGILNINDRQQLKNTNALNSTTTANEKFNLIQLSNIPYRFELLPVASGQYQPGQSQSSAGAPSQQQANTQAHNNQYKSNMKLDEMNKKSTAASSGLFGFKWF